MLKVKSALPLMLVAVVSMGLIGCGGEKKPNYGGEEFRSAYPPKMEEKIEKEFKESIYAVGIATNVNQKVAYDKAGLAADVEIAKVFEQEIANLQKSFTEAVNDEVTEDYRQTVESFTLFTLRGSRMAMQLVSEGKDGYTAYVLKVVSPQIIKDQLDAMKDAQTAIKAQAAYAELEDRIEKEKARRAAAQ
ncbi:MAG: hypothetical protein FWF51_02670 [Chitinivibrionia bacterium]|nr:hypothetical protein [Chitinivibrionia bacterium]